MVDNISLDARAPLADIDHSYDGISLAQITSRAIISIASPLGGEQKLAKAITKSYAMKLPKTGYSTQSKDKNTHLLGLQPDMVFMVFEHEGNDGLEQVRRKLGSVGYYSDQSDSWVIVELTGPKTRLALERICLLDLNPKVFLEGAVSRTQMEHLGTIIFRSGPDSFTLFSARSSAKSFIHALKTSITNVTD